MSQAILSSMGVKPVKCHKKDPSTCRIHGNKYTNQQKMVAQFLRQKEREAAKAKKLREFSLKIEADLTKNLNLKTHPDGSTTCSVYRSGIISAPEERGVEKESYLKTDEYAPEGRQGRTTAIFASPTVGGVNRWVAGNSFVRIPDIKVRELTIDIDKTYVYSIDAWEIASSRMDRVKNPEDYHNAYWQTGITMREWLDKVKENPEEYDPRNWELLIPKESVKKIKPVSGQRVAAYNYSEYESDKKEILQLLK